jgi:two-component system OmpR family sensor kinase
MQLARAESQPLRRAPQDLVGLSIEAADACWQQAEARGLRIAGPALEPGDAVCACDAMLVRRALVNLLDNALRHAPPGSQVDLGLERDGAGWRLSVSHRGPGVRPADRTRTFEPWWRGRDADPSSGVGLGLAVVATVAERHGGAARALGRDAGGARIELWLPDGVDRPSSE